jgi:hypothetical protein
MSKLPSPTKLSSPLNFGVITAAAFVAGFSIAASLLPPNHAFGIAVVVGIIAAASVIIGYLSAKMFTTTTTGGGGGTVPSGSTLYIPCAPGIWSSFVLDRGGRIAFTDRPPTKAGDVLYINTPDRATIEVRVERDGDTPGVGLPLPGSYAIHVVSVDSGVREVMIVAM